MDRAQRRLMAALCVSALLHAWLMDTAHRLPAPHASRAAAGGDAAITVLLNEPPVDFLAQDSEQGIAGAANRGIMHTVAAMQVPVAAPKPVERAAAQPAAVTAIDSATLPQPSDPTYYTALNLDVYPKSATALDLGAHLAAGSYLAGQVRATVLIDEGGNVNEVRAIEAAASDIESAARDLLLKSRFTPARKDGRIVKAQVRISLDYGVR